MDIRSIIIKKKEGHSLNKEEIEYAIEGFTCGQIADYQMAALLMAICINGMDEEETLVLAKAMKKSGDIVDLNPIKGVKVDKHSTGGVGDKTTLIVAPIAAALGVKVAKMSGRGLGFTGGTIDKMEAIPGMRTALEKEEFFQLVNKQGLSVIGQTGHIAPADKKIYALRDVTGTVDNISLIASSIMSKKLASGSDKILLDVKCGSGGFMKSIGDAKKLAETMIRIGNGDGKETVCAITNMNQPLGKAIGNSLEVIEAIEVLKGKGPEDISELSIKLAAIMAVLGKVVVNIQEAEEQARIVIENGKALDKLREMIKGQGGDDRVIDDYGLFTISKNIEHVYSTTSGYVKTIETDKLGNCSQKLGAGRVRKEDPIDLGAGIVFEAKIGDYVFSGQRIATVYTDKSEILEEVKIEILESIEFSDKKIKSQQLVREIVGEI